MTSNRTVKFEFLIDADARQIDRFHDALKRMGDGSATSEKTLTSLREELQRFASISDKTENNLQAQISALRGAAASADLTGKQYIKLRTEVSLLEREYKDLTTGIVGIGKAYEQAGRQAEAFDRRAKKIAERQQYLANSGRPASSTTGQPQVARDASGNLIGYPGRMSGYEGTGDMGLGQYGPGNSMGERALSLQQAQDQILAQNRQYYQQMLEAERSLAASLDAIRNEEFQATLADHKRLADAEIENFNRRLSATVNFRNAVKEAQDVMQRIRLQELESQRSFAAQEDLIRNSQHDAEMADYKRRADASVADFDRRLENRVNRKKQRRPNLREVGNVASSVAIGGFFGGPEGLAGSAAGALAGSFFGPGGMVAGAQLGASVGLAAQQARIRATAVADMVAQLNLAKTALAQVSANQADYNQKLEFSRQVSTDYSVGLRATIEGYSKVTAAAAANGLTLKETETIYKGMIASGVAFGASQDDLQSIITATVQILSKGKVSAEEVSGQLGERIPGAVARFAQLTGRSLEQLAKDFKDGKVNMRDFLEFAKGGLNDYDKSAKLIGSSPEKAGERLNLALTRSAELYGTFFQKVGAGFQDLGTAILQWANNNVGALARVASASALFINDLEYQYNQFKNFTHEGVTKLIPGLAPSKTTAQPGQYTISPEMMTQTREQTAREAWRIKYETENFYNAFNPTLFNQSKSNPILGDQAAADDDKAGKAADKETKLREQLDAEERRRAELLANNAIRLADRVFEHQQNLIRKRYELENSLIEATRRAQESALIGPAREALALANRLKAIDEDKARELRGARENTALMQQSVRSSVASAANTARYADVPQSAVGARTSGANNGMATLQGMPGISEYLTGDSRMKGAGYEPAGHGGVRYHEHIATINKRLRDELMAELKRKGFVIGSVDRNTHTYHGAQRAFDVPAYPNLQNLGLPDNKAGEQEFSRMVRAAVTDYLAGSGRNLARTQSGVASGRGRFTTDVGDVRMSEANLRDAQKQQKLIEANIGPISQQRKIAEVNAFTESYRSQTKALQDQQQELALRNDLELKGVSPELIDQQIRLNQLTRDRAETLNTLQGALGKNLNVIKSVTEATDKQIAAQIALDTASSVNAYKTKTKSIQDQLGEFKLRDRLQMEGVRPEVIDQQVELDRVTRTYTATLSALQAQLAGINQQEKPKEYEAKLIRINQETAAYKEQIAAQEALNKAQNDERNVFSFDKSAKAGIDGYIESIGTLNGATSNLVQSGFGGISAALKELQSTGSTDFRKFALGLISDMQDIITQQFIVASLAKLLRGLLGGGGGGFSFSGAGPVQFPGGGGTDFVGAMNTPDLFANGGVMTSSGPLRLQTYARGGIADRPQLALFGEGSRPEAFVPLPDGRRIPVALSYPAIPGASSGGSGSGAFESTDATVTRMVESARQESAVAAATAAATSGGGTVKVQVESTVINNIETVTMDQVQRVADAASARSTARHDAVMRNNPAARRSRGI
jgi:lambda family phage tail tape measure protein